MLSETGRGILCAAPRRDVVCAVVTALLIVTPGLVVVVLFGVSKRVDSIHGIPAPTPRRNPTLHLHVAP